MLVYWAKKWTIMKNRTSYLIEKNKSKNLETEGAESFSKCLENAMGCSLASLESGSYDDTIQLLEDLKSIASDSRDAVSLLEVEREGFERALCAISKELGIVVLRVVFYQKFRHFGWLKIRSNHFLESVFKLFDIGEETFVASSCDQKNFIVLDAELSVETGDQVYSIRVYGDSWMKKLGQVEWGI